MLRHGRVRMALPAVNAMRRPGVAHITRTEQAAAQSVRGRRLAADCNEWENAAMRFACPGLAAFMTVLAITGCSPPPPAVPGRSTAPPAAISWDGAYRGTIQITGLGSGIQREWCETDPRMTVQVTGNKFGYAMPHPNTPGNPTMVYSAAIAPDGSFRSDIGTGVMSGRVTGTHMSGLIDGSACVYSFTADRS
jgi:hypothetical protein